MADFACRTASWWHTIEDVYANVPDAAPDCG
jgi:hypothetical protein